MTKKVCKRNKKRYLRKGLHGNSEYAIQFSCAINGLLHSNYWIQYSVIYEPIEFQIPASACRSELCQLFKIKKRLKNKKTLKT